MESKWRISSPENGAAGSKDRVLRLLIINSRDVGNSGLEADWSVATFATVLVGAAEPTTRSFDTSSVKARDSGISLQITASVRVSKTKRYKPCGNFIAATYVASDSISLPSPQTEVKLRSAVASTQFGQMVLRDFSGNPTRT